jgi:uncharacterized membrane protein
MTRNGLAIASIAVIVAMIAVAAIVATSLTGDAQLPTHWGLNGRPDGFSGKWTALLLPAVIAGGVSLLFYVLPAIEPRRRGLERSQGLYLWGWAALLVMSLLIQLAVVCVALEWAIAGTSFILAGIGIVFLMIGNQLGKSRSMYMIGFRTPWTLASEEVWIKTHRLAGKLMASGGGLLLLAAFLPLPDNAVAFLLLGVIAVSAGLPVLYSYVLWRREQAAGQAKG